MNKFAIKTTSDFERKAKHLFTPESLNELFDFLENHPEKGDIIRGTGGVRKLRWQHSKNNKGKSAGIRVLYHYSKDILIILITLYGKSEKETITKSECNELKKLMPKLISRYKEDL